MKYIYMYIYGNMTQLSPAMT